MSRKTVFVLGAGASCEFGLPAGEGLKGQIANLFNFKPSMSRGDALSYDAIGVASHLDKYELGKCVEAADIIRDALPLALSIDNYIHNRSDNKHIELCGKIGIVRSILAAESASKLFVRRQHDPINFWECNHTWAAKFVQLLTEQCPYDNLRERLSSVAFIVFNYDRCLEHFLCDSLMVSYSLTREDAAALIELIEIYHPYGTVGDLPWMPSSFDKRIGFGEQPDAAKLYKLSKDIKTFTEGTDPSNSEIMAIRRCISEAMRVVFLGFAFHPLNMQLILGEPKKQTRTRKVFGTAMGMSESDRTLVMNSLEHSLFAPSGVLRDVTSSDLFYEYSRSLGFSD